MTSRRSSRPVHRVDGVGPDRAAARSSRATIAREIELETSSRTTAPKRRLRSSLSTASSRSSASSEISVSPSRVTRNAARSVSSMPGKTQLEVVRDHASRAGSASPRVADRDEARQRLGHLDAREALLARVRVAHGDAEARARAPRCTGTAGRARPRAASGRGRSGGRSAPRARRAPRRSRPRPCRSGSPRRRAPGMSSSRQSFDCARRQLEHALAHLGERLLRRAAVGRAHVDARDHLVEQPGDAHHEELVEVRREDRAELDALEQRLVRGRRRARARACSGRATRAPGSGGSGRGLGDRAGRRCQGVPSSPNSGERGVSIR